MPTAAGINQAGRSELARVVRGRRFVTPADAGAELGLDDRVAARKLARWAEAGWMRRVRRGLYVPVPVDVEHPTQWAEDPMVVATTIWQRCFFTGWTTANHWGLTEQTFRTVVLKTTNRVRKSSVEVMGRPYLVTHARPEQMEWGLASLWLEDLRVDIADAARTVIDCLDAPKLGGGIRHTVDILRSYVEQHDPDTLIDYGERLGNRTVFKRLGYALDTLGQGDGQLARACSDRLSSGISLLDPDGPNSGERNPKWHLRVNARISMDDPS
jgi:predicted transcriptional regulator of viral defense system